MRFIKVLSTILITASVLFTMSCASTGNERTVGQFASDAEITTKVKTQLLAENEVKSFDISVETFDGVVQLSGFVDSQLQIDKAVRVATAVNGVKRVQNDLIQKTN